MTAVFVFHTHAKEHNKLSAFSALTCSHIYWQNFTSNARNISPLTIHNYFNKWERQYAETVNAMN